jgi:hypothetical protein
LIQRQAHCRDGPGSEQRLIRAARIDVFDAPPVRRDDAEGRQSRHRPMRADPAAQPGESTDLSVAGFTAIRE